MASPCRLPMLLLLLLLALLTPRARSQDAATPTPGNFSVEAVTPEAPVIQAVFSADMTIELPEPSLVQAAASLQWDQLLNESDSRASFLLCTERGWSGVQDMLAPFPPKLTLPLYASGNLTCFVVFGTAPTIANATVYLPSVRYATPIPMVGKVARALFADVTSGSLFSDPDLPSIGLRVVLAPGLGRTNAGLGETLRRLRTGLTSGSFRDTVDRRFLWTALAGREQQQQQAGSNGGSSPAPTTGPPSRALRTHLRRRGGSSSWGRWLQGGGEEDGTVPADDDSYTPPPANATWLSARGEQWINFLAPVLNGSLSCPFNRLAMTAQKPYLRFDRLQVRRCGCGVYHRPGYIVPRVGLGLTGPYMHLCYTAVLTVNGCRSLSLSLPGADLSPGHGGDGPGVPDGPPRLFGERPRRAVHRDLPCHPHLQPDGLGHRPVRHSHRLPHVHRRA